jgi:hypothetical protein
MRKAAAEGSTISFASDTEQLIDDVQGIDEWIEKTNAAQES